MAVVNGKRWCAVETASQWGRSALSEMEKVLEDGLQGSLQPKTTSWRGKALVVNVAGERRGSPRQVCLMKTNE